MARSRPKLSQTPWSGLDAVRKIMDRFGDFGESLNRMAGALHGLEDSMKHLLGVTSRVTSAMLMLHGSLAYTGTGGRSGGQKQNNSDEPKQDWDQIYLKNRERKKTDKDLDDSEFKAKKERTRKGTELEKKLAQLELAKYNLQQKNAKYQQFLKLGELNFLRYGRLDFNKKRQEALAQISMKRINPVFLNEKENREEYKNTADTLETEKKNAEKIDKTTKARKGPSDTVITNWIMDTEYAFKSMNADPEKAVKEHSRLQEQDQQAQRVVTQISLVGVNKLGQVIESFNQNIKPDLAPNENLYNLGNQTRADHDAWKAKEDAKSTVTLNDAAKKLKQFSDANNLSNVVTNTDPSLPKLQGKNLLNADLPALLNSINKTLGVALSLDAMPVENKDKFTVDPVTESARSLTSLFKKLTEEELKQISDNFNLDMPALQKLKSGEKTSLSQENLAKIFKIQYTGAGAHDALSDVTAYAELSTLIKKFFEIAKNTIDTRSDDQILNEAGLGSADMAVLDQLNRKKFSSLPESQEASDQITNSQQTLQALESAASELAMIKTNFEKGIDVPQGPRVNLSPFKLGANNQFIDQPTLTENGTEILSPTLTPNATPQDYIKKLKDLKEANATGLSGDTSEFDPAMAVLNQGKSITPLDPDVSYSGFKNQDLTSTPQAHRSRVEITPFETTGTGQYARRPGLNVDHMPAMTGPYADDEAYTQDMITKLDQLIASNATNMDGNQNELKALRDVLLKVVEEFKTFKATPILAPANPLSSVMAPPVPGSPNFTGPMLPPPLFFPASIKDLKTNLNNLALTIKRGTNNLFRGIDFSKIIGGSTDSFKEALGSLAKGLFITATATAGAVTGLAQLASPDIFATFQNSMVYLGMTIGQAFITPMLKLSWHIQQVASYFEHMSPELSSALESLATFSIGVVAASLAIKAISFIVSPIAMVAKGLWALTVAIGGTIAAMAKNGIGTTIGNGIAGILGGKAADAMGVGGSWMSPALSSTLKFAGVITKVTVVSALLYEAFAILSDSIFKTNLSFTGGFLNRAIKREEAATNRAMAESEIRPESQEELEKINKNFEQNKKYAMSQIDTSPEDADLFNEKIKKGYGKASFFDNDLDKTDHPMHQLLTDPTVQRLVSHNEREAYAKQYNQAEQNFQKAKKENNTKAMDLNRAVMAGILSDVWKNAQKNPGFFSYAKPSEHMEKLEQYSKGQYMQPGFANQNKTTKESEEARRERAKKDFESGGGMQGLLMSLQSFRSQPSYMGVEEAHRRVQVEALKNDPLEQKLNELKANYLQKMVESLAQIEAGQKQKSGAVEMGNDILNYFGLAKGHK